MVRRIFRLTIEGKGPYDIARILFEDMQHKSSGRAHGRKPCEKLRTRKKRKQNKKDADGGLPHIGQAAVFAQKWRYHAHF